MHRVHNLRLFLGFLRIQFHMQNMQYPSGLQRKLVTKAGLIIGALGFLLSFLLALMMLFQQGNPGFLLIWLTAIIATASCMRMHARWRKSFERMYSPEFVRTLYPSQSRRQHDVEDVVFRDIPDRVVC